jgi:hypothetical protein
MDTLSTNAGVKYLLDNFRSAEIRAFLASNSVPIMSQPTKAKMATLIAQLIVGRPGLLPDDVRALAFPSLGAGGDAVAGDGAVAGGGAGATARGGDAAAASLAAQAAALAAQAQAQNQAQAQAQAQAEAAAQAQTQVATAAAQAQAEAQEAQETARIAQVQAAAAAQVQEQAGQGQDVAQMIAAITGLTYVSNSLCTPFQPFLKVSFPPQGSVSN